MKRLLLLSALLCLLLSALSLFAKGSVQGGDHTLYGDLTVDESNVVGLKPLTFDLILYSEGGGVLIARQPVANNGRFRFNNLATGVYEIAIEVENTEVARIRVDLRSPLLKDVRRDIALQWSLPTESRRSHLLSVKDIYHRNSTNDKLFKTGRDAKDKKNYAKAAAAFQEIIKADPKDFEAWFELGNVHFLQKELSNAENEYLRAIDIHPGYFLALLNLGRLELFQKHHDVAIEVLRQAVKAGPDSADANYFLGEAYLQDKKGSSAVPCFKAAIRLDPIGMAEAHLRLGMLYNRAGYKQLAAEEYEQFLKKVPDFSQRKKLQEYISANKPKGPTVKQ